MNYTRKDFKIGNNGPNEYFICVPFHSSYLLRDGRVSPWSEMKFGNLEFGYYKDENDAQSVLDKYYPKKEKTMNKNFYVKVTSFEAIKLLRDLALKNKYVKITCLPIASCDTKFSNDVHPTIGQVGYYYKERLDWNSADSVSYQNRGFPEKTLDEAIKFFSNKSETVYIDGHKVTFEHDSISVNGNIIPYDEAVKFMDVMYGDLDIAGYKVWATDVKVGCMTIKYEEVKAVMDEWERIRNGE